MLPVPAGQPRLQLLPSSSTIYLPYGRALGFSLDRCANISANLGCGAVAWEEAADGNRTDTTASIVVKGTTPCDGKQVCGAPPPDAFGALDSRTRAKRSLSTCHSMACT
jgi:hypothetical protein